MKESVFRGQINKLLRRLWFWPIALPDVYVCHACGASSFPKEGRPDLICLNPAEPTVVIECKMFVREEADDPREKASLPFSKITDGQRTWLTNFQEDADERSALGGLNNHWTASYLALCTSHGRAGSKKNPRHAWLPPWSKWLELEEMVGKVRKSLPLTAIRKRDAGLGAIGLLAPWALLWEHGGWAVKIDHPLWVPELRDLDEFSKKWDKE